MYVDVSSRRIKTYQRPRVPKLTVQPPRPRHILEDLLSHSLTRKILGWITDPGKDDKCFFERLCENYDRDWRLATWLIDTFWVKRAGLDKEYMKFKLPSQAHGPRPRPDGAEHRALRPDRAPALRRAALRGVEFHPGL